MKRLYFLFNLAMPFYFMYANLHFRRLGFSGTQIGLISSSYFLMNFLCQPLWGYISDAFRARRKVMMALIFISSVTVLAYLRATSFIGILFTAAALGTTFSAVMPILDATGLDYVRRAGDNYGNIRLWGSVGFMVAGVIGGQLTGFFGIRSVFIACSAALIGMGLISISLPKTEEESETPHDIEGSRIMVPDLTKTQQIKILLSNRKFLIFLVATFLVQACMSMGFGFLNIHVSNLGAADAFIGIIWAVAALSEIPAFKGMAYFQRRLGSRGLILMSYTTLAIRWFLFYLVKTPLMIIPVQLLQGFSGGYYFGGSVMFVQEEAPEGLKATGQTIFGAVSMGLGPIVGMTLGGQLVDRWGLANLFIFCGVVTGITAFMFAMTLRERPHGQTS